MGSARKLCVYWSINNVGLLCSTTTYFFNVSIIAITEAAIASNCPIEVR